MSEPRYGIWIPVYGNCGVMNHPLEPRDASYSRAKNLIQLAQKCGFTTTLIAQHIINPRNQELDQLETWTAAAALAEATNSIEIIAAVKPLLFHPAVLAKMALGIDAISHGRFSINLVSAWFKPEMEKPGINFLTHDERYRYSDEWIRVVKALWSGEKVNFYGEYFQINDLKLNPPPIAKPHPRVYVGGESEPAQEPRSPETDEEKENFYRFRVAGAAHDLFIVQVCAKIIDSFADPELQLFLSRQIGDDGAHAQNTRLRAQAISGRDPIEDIQKQVQKHWDYLGDLPIRNWQGFLAFELHYELHIVALLFINSRTSKINDPDSAKFAAERILPDEAVHRLGVVDWWQRKFDRASPAEKEDLIAQVIKADEEGQRRRNPYLRDHWQLSQKAIGIEISDRFLYS